MRLTTELSGLGYWIIESHHYVCFDSRIILAAEQKYWHNKKCEPRTSGERTRDRTIDRSTPSVIEIGLVNPLSEWGLG